MREWQSQPATTRAAAVDRRQLLKCTPALLLAATACYRSTTDFTAQPPRPPGVPVSSFGASSTAEAVTAGLDLTGKLALVTGATSGLGLETARVLALRGAQVIVAGRTLERAEQACRALGGGRTLPLALELEDWPGIVGAAATVTALVRPLDLLICNAGLMTPRELRLVNGVEQQFAVNHLGHFILCQRLLGRLTAAPQGRVVVVSSAAAGLGPDSGIDFENLDGHRGYDPMKMYAQSKLANALFAFALARRLGGTRVTANALHPGVIHTNLDRASRPLGRLRSRVMAWNNPRVKSVAAGAATQVYVATAPALAGVTGHYFEDCNPVLLGGPHLGNVELGEALWAKSEALTRRYLS
jgi:NAD(P)-dependent dehydrogenase (short-subunit alcohol dehydrogenase family)